MLQRGLVVQQQGLVKRRLVLLLANTDAGLDRTESAFDTWLVLTQTELGFFTQMYCIPEKKKIENAPRSRQVQWAQEFQTKGVAAAIVNAYCWRSCCCCLCWRGCIAAAATAGEAAVAASSGEAALLLLLLLAKLLLLPLLARLHCCCCFCWLSCCCCLCW